MTKPDIQAKEAELVRWVDDEVRPYLQSLLNTAQRKIKTTIQYRNSMGVSYIDFGDRHDNPHRDSDCDDLWVQSRGDSVFFRRFPELLEFRTIATDLWNLLRLEPGDILPTVRPRRNPS